MLHYIFKVNMNIISLHLYCNYNRFSLCLIVSTLAIDSIGDGNFIIIVITRFILSKPQPNLLYLCFSVFFQNKVLPGTFWWKHTWLGARQGNIVCPSTQTWSVWETALRINLSAHCCHADPGLASAETPGITGLTRSLLPSLTGTRTSLTTTGTIWNHVSWLKQAQEHGGILTVRKGIILSVKKKLHT